MGSTITKILFVIFCLIYISVTVNAISIPALPTEFYGKIYINTTGAPLGARINVSINYSNTIIPCGTYIINHIGYYGVVSCMGLEYDLNTLSTPSDLYDVIFQHDILVAHMRGDNSFKQGDFHNVNISFTYNSCGNWICQDNENSINCPFDCGSSNASNTTTNQTGGSGEETGEGTGGGTSSGGGSTSGASAGGDITQGAGAGTGEGSTGATSSSSTTGIAYETCTEKWVCAEWSRCWLGVQERTCNDINNCISEDDKPYTSRECATCDDGLQNQGETGIDCGGPCISCVDKAKADSKLPPILEKPFSLIKEAFEDCRKFPLMTFLTLLAIAIILFVGYEIYYKQMMKSTKLKKNYKKRLYLFRRRIWWISLSMASISIFISLYLFMIYSCNLNSWNYIVMLILSVILFPYVFYKILTYYEVSRKKKLNLIKKILNKYIEKLSEIKKIEKDLIVQLSEKITDKILRFTDEKSDELKHIPKIVELYEKIVTLQEYYIDKKDSPKTEKELVDIINNITKIKKIEETMNQFDKELFYEITKLRDYYQNKYELENDIFKMQLQISIMENELEDIGDQDVV